MSSRTPRRISEQLDEILKQRKVADEGLQSTAKYVSPFDTLHRAVGPGSCFHLDLPSRRTPVSLSEYRGTEYTFDRLDAVMLRGYRPASNHPEVTVDMPYNTSIADPNLRDWVDEPKDIPFANNRQQDMKLYFRWPGYDEKMVFVPVVSDERGALTRADIVAGAATAIRMVMIDFAWNHHRPSCKDDERMKIGMADGRGVRDVDVLLRSLTPLYTDRGEVVWAPMLSIRRPLVSELNDEDERPRGRQLARGRRNGRVW
ncbi:hypothetical protein EVG20_g10305 [Dentipellis fragilis]|uniref:Uncharacterized protein n=1 Tax=Dentipellis fragilis TaxID=205917 RepID=A0A4Y9XSC1_9AGAM|nr:hypothetical protein EVG20_g10305 [Dentipellis fragilis]